MNTPHEEYLYKIVNKIIHFYQIEWAEEEDKWDLIMTELVNIKETK